MAGPLKISLFFRSAFVLLALSVLTGCVTTSPFLKQDYPEKNRYYSDPLTDSLSHYEKALVSMNEGHYAEASVRFQSAIDRISGLAGREKDLAFIHSEKADCHIKLAQPSSAESNYYKAMAWDPTNSRYAFMLANLYNMLNRYDQSLEIYRKVLAANTNAYEALYNMATVYDMQGDIVKAVSSYEKVLEMRPDHSLSAYNMMNLLIRHKKFGMAVEKFMALPSTMKNNEFLQLEQAYCLKKTGHYAKAFSVLSNIRITEQIDPVMLLQELAENSYFLENGTNTLEYIRKMDAAGGVTMLYQSMANEIRATPDNIRQTLAVFNQLVASDGMNLLAHFGKYRTLVKMSEKDEAVEELLLMGKIAFSENNVTSASQFFSKAKLLRPRSALPYTLMAILYEDGGNISRSVDEIRQAITIHPTSSTLYRYLGSLYEQKGEMRNSFGAFEKASKLDDTNIETVLKLGYLAALIDKPFESITYFKKALKIRTNDISIIGLIALSYLNVSRYSNALPFFKQVENMDPGYDKVQYYIGMCYERTGETVQAVEYFEKAVTVNSNDAEALNYLAYLLADKDMDYERALALVTRALSVDPTNPVYLDTLGWTQFKFKRYDEALKNLQEAFRIFTVKKMEEPVILEHLGDVYYEIKNSSQALRYWRLAAGIDKKSQTLQNKIRSVQNRKLADK